MHSTQRASLAALGQAMTQIAALAAQAEEEAAAQDPMEGVWSPQHRRIVWQDKEYWVCYMPLHGLTPCPVCEEEVASGFVDIASEPDGGARVTFETIHILSTHAHDLKDTDEVWRQRLLAEAAHLQNVLGIL